jgi:hypothetical protein
MIVTRELQLEQIALDKIKGLKVEKLQGYEGALFSLVTL